MPAQIRRLIVAVDRFLNLDWENSVRIDCPDDGKASEALNELQSARDAIDGRAYYMSRDGDIPRTEEE